MNNASLLSCTLITLFILIFLLSCSNYLILLDTYHKKSRQIEELPPNWRHDEKNNIIKKKFKIEVCKQIERGESTVSSIAKEYTISQPIVSRWLAEYKRYKSRAFSGKGNRLPDKAKLYASEKEV